MKKYNVGDPVKIEQLRPDIYSENNNNNYTFIYPGNVCKVNNDGLTVVVNYDSFISDIVKFAYDDDLDIWYSVNYDKDCWLA